jgi:hypothetical protein
MRLFGSHFGPAVLALAAAAMGCQPDFRSGVTRCSASRQCPDNLVCETNGVCYTPVDSARGGNGGRGGNPDGDGGTGGSDDQPDAASGTGGAGDAQSGPDRAPPPATCADFAAAWCAKKASCEPLDNPFPSDAECRKGMQGYCENAFLDQPDSNWTPATAGVCVAEMKISGCFAWLGLPASRKCDPRGKRGGGTGVYSWVQCESAASYWRGGSCGYCYATAAAGQTCGDDAVCPEGHLCSRAKRCRPASLNGQACGDDSPCHPAFMCNAGVCGPRGLADAACKTDDDCDGSLSLRCNVALGRCRKAVVGSSWNRGNTDGTVNVCAPGSGPQTTGTCVPYAGDGAPCVVSGDGPLCQLPRSCVAGKCVVPAVIECPEVRPPEGYPPGKDPWCNLNTARPLYCPARGDLSWNCWPADTSCATVTHCGNQLKACPTANLTFDCQTMKCIENPCTDPAFPTSCSDKTDDALTGCWSPGTRCSTATNCAGKPVACTSDKTSPDCTLGRCVPACEIPLNANTCSTCVSKRCCGSYGACQGDPMCASKAGSNWTALDACAKKFCTAECTSAPLSPPPPK